MICRRLRSEDDVAPFRKVVYCIGISNSPTFEMVGDEAVMTHLQVSYGASLSGCVIEPLSRSWDDVEFGSAASDAKPITA